MWTGSPAVGPRPHPGSQGCPTCPSPHRSPASGDDLWALPQVSLLLCCFAQGSSWMPEDSEAPPGWGGASLGALQPPSLTPASEVKSPVQATKTEAKEPKKVTHSPRPAELREGPLPRVASALRPGRAFGLSYVESIRIRSKAREGSTSVGFVLIPPSSSATGPASHVLSTPTTEVTSVLTWLPPTSLGRY